MGQREMRNLKMRKFENGGIRNLEMRERRDRQ
jgi:hypothetical protein